MLFFPYCLVKLEVKMLDVNSGNRRPKEEPELEVQVSVALSNGFHRALKSLMMPNSLRSGLQ